MSSGEKSRTVLLPTVVTMAAALAISGCSSKRNPNAVHIDHSVKEPVCTGVTVEHISTDPLEDKFKIIPKLRGSFTHPKNVRTALEVVLEPAPSTLSPTSEATGSLLPPSVLPNTGGGNTTYQVGPSYVTHLQAASHVPGQLIMLDFQNNTPPNLEKTGGIPAGVPEIDCPPADLGALAYPSQSPARS